MKDEEKAKEFANYFAGETDYKESAAYSSAIAMAEWKDEQYRIDKTHLNMVYEALNRLYQVRYDDKPILNTGSQTDVFLYMIEDIIDDIKSKIKL